MPAPSAPGKADKPTHRRRWRRLAWIALPLVALGFWINHLMQPEALGAIVMSQARQASGLDISSGPPPRVGWYPDLHVELEALSASIPGDDAALLQAEAVDLVLPWSSLIDIVTGSDSSELRISTLRLRRPNLDLDRMRRWFEPTADGPPTPFVLPRIDSALRIEGGQLRQRDGLQVEDLNLTLSSLHEGSPMEINAEARLRSIAAVSGDAPVALQPEGFPLSLDLRSTPIIRSGELHLEQMTMQLRSGSDELTLLGQVVVVPGGGLRIDIKSNAAAWPSIIPALPLPPENQQFDLNLLFDGSLSGQGMLTVDLMGNVDRIVGELRLGDLTSWIAEAATDNPESTHGLPPIKGTLNASRLQQGDNLMSDVVVEFSGADETPSSNAGGKQ